jgi:tRNA threonylcarbamoyl adenosine modification protein YeaZ
MRVLAIDTATNRAAAAVAVAGRVVAERTLDAPGEAARSVLGLVDEVLGEAGVALRDLDLIAVGTGPGSFTGIRIAVATAVALGDAVPVPVTGISTFAGLLHGGDRTAVAVIDARRGEVFARAAGVPDRAWAPADLARVLPPGATLVGDGALRYRPVFLEAGLVVPDDVARHGVSAGALALAAAPGCDPAPTYLREPDAVASEPG